MALENKETKYRHYLSSGLRAVSGDTKADLVEQLDSFAVPSSKNELTIARGQVDSAALFIRHHNPEIHLRNLPSANEARLVFDKCEQVRVEVLGMQVMDGVAQNIIVSNKHNSFATNLDDAQYFKIEAIDNLLRSKLLKKKLKPSAKIKPYIEKYEGYLAPYLHDLNQNLKDQQGFASLINIFLHEINLDQSDEAGMKEVSQDDLQEVSEQDVVDIGENEESDSEVESNDKESEDIRGQGDTAPSPSAEINDKVDSSTKSKPHESLPLRVKNKLNMANYSFYTNAYDEIVDASSLCSEDELEFLRKQLDIKAQKLGIITKRAANRLKQQLMAKDVMINERNLDEGRIDGSRLSQVVADPNYRQFYQWQRYEEKANTVVSLLIDNSGSMRGKPITVAALCADILAKTLETAGIKVEVLGFTTKEWKGGESRKAWEREGKSTYPGRLNDLRHIIYKAADTPWRRIRKNMGLMLREGLLKENIDGEAVIWAQRRLLMRPENRKILMVISDGAPVDDSSLSENSSGYLDKHLREVIADIEGKSEVELLAIGIGHNVNDYYSHAVTLKNVEELGGTMFDELAQLLQN